MVMLVMKLKKKNEKSKINYIIDFTSWTHLAFNLRKFEIDKQKMDGKKMA